MNVETNQSQLFGCGIVKDKTSMDSEIRKVQVSRQSRGRIVYFVNLPKSMCNLLEIDETEKVSISCEDGKIIIEPLSKMLKRSKR